MANRMKGEAAFDHAGRTRTVRVTMDMLLTAEDAAGIGFFDLVNSSRVGHIAELLRHGLAAAGEALISRSDAAELLLDAPQAKQAISDAIDAAFPAPAGADDAGAPEGNAKRRGGTGTKS